MIENLSERIRELRIGHNLSQTDLSRKINVTNALISAFEKGERSPSLITLMKLADFFQVSTDYLLGIKQREPLNLEGLSPNDKQAITTLVQSLKSKNH